MTAPPPVHTAAGAPVPLAAFSRAAGVAAAAAHARPARALAEYIYLGGAGTDLHSVTRVVEGGARAPADLPLVCVDGSATGQATPAASALFLKPRAAFDDPVRGGGALLVLCDAYAPPEAGGGGGAATPLAPHPSNNRAVAAAGLEGAADDDPLLSVTQQYLVVGGDGVPIGWPSPSGPPPHSAYGAPSPLPAALADAHLTACLGAGLAVTGARAEAVAGQASFSVGPLPPLDAADQLWTARFLLHRAAAALGVSVALDALPHAAGGAPPEAWPGNAASLKLSTRATRGAATGVAAIRDAVDALADAHAAHVMVYGAGAAARLARGGVRTPGPTFSAGVESLTASVRVPAAVALHGRGHFEDRRPAGGCDPYLAATVLVCTALRLPLPGGGAAGGYAAAATAAAAAAAAAHPPSAAPPITDAAALLTSSRLEEAGDESGGGGAASCGRPSASGQHAPDTPPLRRGGAASSASAACGPTAGAAAVVGSGATSALRA